MKHLSVSSKIYYLNYLLTFISLKVKEIKRDFLSIHSLNSKGWVSQRVHMGLPHGWQEFSSRAIACCLPRCTLAGS